MKSIFFNDNLLDRYEQQELWEECVIYLKEIACLHYQDRSVALRLAAQCWYVLTFWSCCMPKEKLNRRLFEATLETAYNVARKYWWNDPDCLWLFGYFMSINQMDFHFISPNIWEVECEGNHLISLAYSFAPNNELAQMLYLLDNRKKQKYRKMVKQVAKRIIDYFPSQSAIDRYFREVFSRTD